MEQLRSPEDVEGALDEALEVMKSVARDVDNAMERRNAAVKSGLILERLEVHPVRSSFRPVFKPLHSTVVIDDLT